MPIPKLNLACLGVRTKLLLLQLQQNHPVHMSHVHILSHGAPCLMWLYEHVMLHIQHRVRTGLFPVPLCAVISLIRPSQIRKKQQSLRLFPQLSTMQLQQEEEGMNLQY